MRSALEWFEGVARRAYRFSEAPSGDADDEAHPFERRNIHPGLPATVRRLFDDGHFAQATFEAYKHLDNEVKRHSGDDGVGHGLMMRVLGGVSPAIQLTPLSNKSERDEQDGYKFIFAGAVLAIRNPRGHETEIADSVDNCLDHLSLASLLLRRLAESGYT